MSPFSIISNIKQLWERHHSTLRKLYPPVIRYGSMKQHAKISAQHLKPATQQVSLASTAKTVVPRTNQLAGNLTFLWSFILLPSTTNMCVKLPSQVYQVLSHHEHGKSFVVCSSTSLTSKTFNVHDEKVLDKLEMTTFQTNLWTLHTC